MDIHPLLAALTPAARNEPDSGIVKAAMYGFTKPNVIPLWAGEGNLPTPEAFARPAIESLLKGETFYTWQRGIPELRDSLARYHERHFGRPFSHENFFVTSGGMQAIQTVIQMIAGEGDEIVIPTPAWPNYAGSLRIQGSLPVEVPMQFENGRWLLDLDRLFAAATPRTRAIALNSPSNPVGWTASRDELVAVRDFCRKRGLWIFGDEVYSRFYFGEKSEKRAPSFLDICDDEEMLLLANTFSKNWAMTGWRVGWLQAPKVLGPAIERIIQYNSSGTPAFLQRGCVAALEHGEDFVKSQIARARANRDLVVAALRDLPRVRFEIPRGAFYLFFGLDGMSDSTSTVLRIIDEAGVGFAPGATFGPGGEGHLRLCFLRDPDKLVEALDRFGRWLKTAPLD
ncbi:MAG: pyridoxal phosphate-dependent aminotransferase [Rhizobiales bacterium]|nr:pyridoxal phosphate-dependent aminotransferase [Hyphomicrobiales bacterium]MBI3673059.1 pyridoxal phosphate-dependent aminotransferase [Hyphomicrobiales bacterium]